MEAARAENAVKRSLGWNDEEQAGRRALRRAPWTTAAVRGLLLLCLAVFSAGTLTFYMPRSVGSYDEGLILFGAARVLAGDLPYRDFWTMYSPAAFYAPALLFAAFGESVLVLRAFDMVTKTFIVLACFQIVAKLGSRSFGLGGALAVLVLLILLPSPGFPIFQALAGTLAAVLALQRAIRVPGNRGAAFASGVAVGAALLFRQDLGIYAFAVCSAWLAWLRTASGERTDAPSRFEGLLMPFAAGTALLVLPVAGMLAFTIPAADLYQNLVHLPLEVYPQVRSLPFPTAGELLGQLRARDWHAALASIAVYAPALVVLAGLAIQVRRAARPRTESDAASMYDRTIWPLLALTAMFCLKGLVRVEPLHMLPALILAMISLAAMAGCAASSSSDMRRNPLAAAALIPGAALLLVGAGALSANLWPTLHKLMREGLQSSSFAAQCRSAPTPQLKCFKLDPLRTEVLEEVLRRTDPGDAIYVGAGRHDKLFVNNVELYFLAARRSPTKWHDLHPGVQTTEAVQREMIAEMSADPPALVALSSEWDDMQEPNASRYSSGVHLLDDYLQRNYRPVARIRHWTLLEPR